MATMMFATAAAAAVHTTTLLASDKCQMVQDCHHEHPKDARPTQANLN